MRWSLTTSFILHAAILAGALVILPNPKEFIVAPQQAILVDISNISDKTKLANVSKAEEPQDKPKQKKVEAPKQETKPAPKVEEKVKKAEVEPKPQPKPEPKPEPKKEEPKPDELKDLIKDTLAETPEPKKDETKKVEPKKAEAKPKEKPKKVEKKKPKPDLDEIAAFLNKADDVKAAPETQSDGETTEATASLNLKGNDAALSATIIDALIQRIKECWTVPPGAREAEIVVKVRLKLNMDGTILGVPEIMTRSGDQLIDATARSAVSAVMECQAYSFLPADQYDLWKDLIINFNPNMMFDS